ncbi:MAG: S1C family serine protease [bacterium]
MRKYLITLSYLLTFLAGFLVCFYLYTRMTEKQIVSVSPTSIPIRVKGESPFIAAINKAGPAVVNIDTTYQPSSSIFGFFLGEEPDIIPPAGKGSGVIIRPDGLVLTNYHVISGARSIKVTLIDGRQFNARVVGTDPQSDIALLRIKGDNFPYLQLGSSSNLRVGDWVIAIGNPFGLSNTATVGIVSAIRKGPFRVEGKILAASTLIQTDAAINKGNSGGALVNLAGELVGICTAILTPPMEEGNVGIGFAIAIDAVKGLLPELEEKGRVAHAWLGIRYRTLDSSTKLMLGIPDSVRGAIIESVMEGSPAQRAGLRPGDIIVGMDGKGVKMADDVMEVMLKKKVGDELILKVWREGKEIALRAKLGEQPPSF